MKIWMIFINLMLFLSWSLGACSTPTAYKAADGDKPGYRDQKLEENRFRVTFKGNKATSRETVENYLLYRAAELTLANGNDYFIVTKQSTEADTDFQVTSPAVYGYYSTGYSRFPYYTYGFPWAHSTNVTTNKQYEATAYIVTRSGDPPKNSTDAFDARQVKANLEAKIIRPD